MGVGMRFKSVITTAPNPKTAAAELIAGADGHAPDLACLFTSHHYEPEFETLLGAVYNGIDARNLIGCAAESVIGPSQELENQPAAVLWLAELPGTRVFPFIIDLADLQTITTPSGLRERISGTADDRPGLIVLPDPFSVPADELLGRMDAAFPGSPVVGGMASGADSLGQTRLFLNDQVLRQGAVGVSLTGDVQLTTVVSRGCRPVGETYVITGCEGNIITELGGRSPMDVLQAVFSESPPPDRELMEQGVHLGRAVDESGGPLTPDDFVVRNILAVVGGKAIAVGDYLRLGQTVQFHVRDARTADHEMRTLLRSRVVDRELSPRGGLLFTCAGRGAGLFGGTGHDIGVVNELIDSCEVAGFFAGGEIGPIGNATFVHGFTSNLVLFTPAS